MAASIYLSQKPRPMDADLPTHSAAVREKWKNTYHSSWILPYTFILPGFKTRRIRVMLPNVYNLHPARITRKRSHALLVVGVVAVIFTIVMSISLRGRIHFVPEDRTWPHFSRDPPTLVYRREDLQRIWQWEISAGHYPTGQKIPETVGLTSPPANPGLPPTKKASTIPTRFRPPSFTSTIRIGPKRNYPDIHNKPPNVEYPPRPLLGGVADMDTVMEHCDFSRNKYVRDCLEVLRVGSGLDTIGPRLRRGKVDSWKYIYVEEGDLQNTTQAATPLVNPALTLKSTGTADPNAGFVRKWGADWEPHVFFPPPPKYIRHSQRPESCEDNPHLFHMFWAGPFTDKPYLALLSFLYTQNLGLHLDRDHVDPTHCRPKFLVWINPGPAASVPNPSAVHDMFESLAVNPWASPFLHPRFKDVIQFKLWNTTEQLDSIPELKDEWRNLRDELFNSGGVVEKIPQPKAQSSEESESIKDTKSPTGSDDQVNRVGSKSRSSYDKLSVILSDMARFVLCHRFGGIYLDVDNILLRDWEELWGWKGAFAYRWSRLPSYNTAVLKLNKGSALGTFLFRTALRNRLDFHPMTVSRYTKDAALESLLLRLPDALFDPAWLNTEDYQRDRPPQPYFLEFGDFFFTPKGKSAAPGALGFQGFFRGAYSYHFHNFWWQPFDAVRNWPDLGPQFMNGERQARFQAQDVNKGFQTDKDILPEDIVTDDKRDLDWSTVLKRTFEAYIRGEAPNMYGEWLKW